MPLGLKNAPATFQSVMDVIFAFVRWQFALVYLSDTVVFRKTPADRIEQVRSVLRLLYVAGVTLKLKKCKFFAEISDYVGHVIQPGGMDLAENTTNAVEKFEEYTTQTKLRSFFGLCNMFRPFVPNFSRLGGPLNKKVRKDEPKQFGPLDEMEGTSVATLKKALTSPPALALPTSEGRYMFNTDACDKQGGCVFVKNKRTEVIALLATVPEHLMTRSGNWPKRTGSAWEVVKIVTLLRRYLKEAHFTIRTGHEALRWTFTTAEATGKLVGGCSRLSEFKFDIAYFAGVKHQAAYAL